MSDEPTGAQQLAEELRQRKLAMEQAIAARETIPFPDSAAAPAVDFYGPAPPSDGKANESDSAAMTVSGSGGAQETRARWSSETEFFVTCVGYAVGLGNFWRFPYLCYKHGGGAFLVPYTIVLLLIGMPLFALELFVGQKFQVGPLHAWQRIHPALGGLGWTSCLATFFVALYYNVIVAWSLWYLFHSFASRLPWAAEGGARGAVDFWEVDTLHCRANADAASDELASELLGGGLSVPSNASCSWAGVDFDDPDAAAAGGAGLSLFSPGGVVWPLLGCLALAWLLIYLCVCKGIASVGKVALFTAIFPYVVLAILLVRGVTLPGAAVGLRFYLTPQWHKLADPAVWIAAASQIFYSVGVGWGTLVAFASYNDASHNFVRDAWRAPMSKTAFRGHLADQPNGAPSG